MGEARAHFFRAIEQHAQPAVLALRDRVLVEYQAAREELAPGSVTFQWPAKLREKFAAFAADFHLTKDGKVPGWVCRQLEETLRIWAVFPALVQGERLSLGGVTGYQSKDRLAQQDLRIELPSFDWHPRTGFGETRQQAEQQILAEVSEILHACMDEIEEGARRDGLRPTREKHLEHFHWAVRFQVGGADVPTIASSVGERGIEDRSVRLAIEQVLKLVGLERRKQKPGPKRKP